MIGVGCCDGKIDLNVCNVICERPADRRIRAPSQLCNYDRIRGKLRRAINCLYPQDIGESAFSPLLLA